MSTIDYDVLAEDALRRLLALSDADRRRFASRALAGAVAALPPRRRQCGPARVELAEARDLAALAGRVDGTALALVAAAVLLRAVAAVQVQTWAAAAPGQLAAWRRGEPATQSMFDAPAAIEAALAARDALMADLPAPAALDPDAARALAAWSKSDLDSIAVWRHADGDNPDAATED